MLRRFDGSRVGHLRTPAADRFYPEIGSQAMSSHPRIEHALPGALFRALRAATRSDHVEVERFTARLRLDNRKEYTYFLNLHQCALTNLRGDCRAEDQNDFQGMSKCLDEDLQALGSTRLKLYAAPRSPLVFGNRLGVSYFFRTLRLSAKQERSRVPRGFPTAYLDFVPTLPWASFLEQLETGADGPKETSDYEVLRGARVAFELLVGILRQARM